MAWSNVESVLGIAQVASKQKKSLARVQWKVQHEQELTSARSSTTESNSILIIVIHQYRCGRCSANPRSLHINTWNYHCHRNDKFRCRIHPHIRFQISSRLHRTPPACMWSDCVKASKGYSEKGQERANGPVHIPAFHHLRIPSKLHCTDHG